MEGEIFWAFLILGTMSTMVSRPILKNPFTFAYKFYNIELGVANYTGVASHGWLTIRWLVGETGIPSDRICDINISDRKTVLE